MKDTYFYIYWKLSPQFLTTKLLHMLRSVVLSGRLEFLSLNRNLKFLLKVFLLVC